MFYSLLDLIVCPNCRNFLTLLIPEEIQQSTTMRMKRACRASPKGAKVGPLPPQPEETNLRSLLGPIAASPATDGRDREVSVIQGILVCLHCNHWYPIRNGLPELLPDHLRDWDEDLAWLKAQHTNLVSAGLIDVGEALLTHERSLVGTTHDEGAHYKKAEMAVTQRSLPEGFFGYGRVAPFNPFLPSFSLDLLARFVTTVSRFGCGLNAMVLDLGVGYGWTTEWLVRLGYQAIGIDICRDYIFAGLFRMGLNLPHLLVGDIENLPLRDECVEAVLSFDAFHHVPNRHQAMGELGRVMRPGTKMVMIEPGPQHEKTPLSVAVMEQHGILERGFDQNDLSDYVKNTALGEIVRIGTDVHPHDIFTLKKSGVFEPDSLAPRALSAAITVQPERGVAEVDRKPELTVSITNRGDTVWLNDTPDGIGEVHLGASLFEADHTLLKEDYGRVVLPRSVHPGERVQLHCALPPILRPGSYVVELDMVIEGLLWFKSYAFHPLRWPLTVVGNPMRREWNGPIVAEPGQRIVPTDVSFEPGLVRDDTPSKNVIVHPPLTQLLLLAWQVIKTDGPFAFSRRVWNYFRWRFSTK